VNQNSMKKVPRGEDGLNHTTFRRLTRKTCLKTWVEVRPKIGGSGYGPGDVVGGLRGEEVFSLTKIAGDERGGGGEKGIQGSQGLGQVGGLAGNAGGGRNRRREMGQSGFQPVP